MTYVIDPQDGTKIPCMWEDCWKPGREEFKAIVTEGAGGPAPRAIHYVFCSLRHKAYWTNSHVSHKNLATGDKGLLT